MKVGVCVKQVPDTDVRIKVASPEAGIDQGEINKTIINPYDEFAVEEALALKDAGKATEVIVFTVGDSSVESKLRSDVIAKGATRAVRLDDAAFAGSDALGIARILAKAIEAEGCDIVFAGKQAIDGDNAQVPIMIAEILGASHVSVVDQIEYGDGSLKAWRRGAGGKKDIVQASLPAVITCERGLNSPRRANMKGIMMAKKAKIEVKDAAALGLEPGSVGADAAQVHLTNWSPPPERPAGRIIEGDNATRVKELVRLLREEAKVI